MNPIPIGVREDTPNKEPFYIEDRRRHLVCWGMTGVGKSTLLQNIAEWNIREGLGCTIIDPHGSIVENVLRRIPKPRTFDVIYINPLLTKVVGINIFAGVGTKNQKVSALVDMFIKMFGDNFQESSQSVLRYASLACLDLPYTPTLITIKRFLDDENFFDKVVANAKDPLVKLEYRNYHNKEWRKEYVARKMPVRNKLDQFITNTLSRAMVGQRAQSFDFRELIDKNKILLCNLSEGGIGKQEAAMLGGFIFSKLFFAGLSRQDIAESKRQLHTIIIDEFQNFINAPIDYVLAESRKYGLSLNLGTQIASALPLGIRQHIFGNAGTNAVYRVGGVDAEILLKELSTNKQAYELQDLADYRAYVRTLVYDKRLDAMRPTGPYKIRMNPPLKLRGDEQKKNLVIEKSLKIFATDRDFILKKIDEELSV